MARATHVGVIIRLMLQMATAAHAAGMKSGKVQKMRRGGGDEKTHAWCAVIPFSGRLRGITTDKESEKEPFSVSNLRDYTRNLTILQFYKQKTVKLIGDCAYISVCVGLIAR